MTQEQNINNYKSWPTHQCGDWYNDPTDSEEWRKCPKCRLRPKIWVFNNGEQTACGCGNNMYDHFYIKAEPILAVYRRCNGDISEYDSDELRKKWNTYCFNSKEQLYFGDKK